MNIGQIHHKSNMTQMFGMRCGEHRMPSQHVHVLQVLHGNWSCHTVQPFCILTSNALAWDHSVLAVTDFANFGCLCPALLANQAQLQPLIPLMLVTVTVRLWLWLQRGPNFVRRARSLRGCRKQLKMSRSRSWLHWAAIAWRKASQCWEQSVRRCSNSVRNLLSSGATYLTIHRPQAIGTEPRAWGIMQMHWLWPSIGLAALQMDLGRSLLFSSWPCSAMGLSQNYAMMRGLMQPMNEQKSGGLQVQVQGSELSKASTNHAIKPARPSLNCSSRFLCTLWLAQIDWILK